MPSTVQRSTGITRSEPTGTAAPVATPNASPGRSAALGTGSPAATLPTTVHGPGPATAYPSIAEVSHVGWSASARTPDASAKPTASGRTSSTASNGFAASCAVRRASGQHMFWDMFSGMFM